MQPADTPENVAAGFCSTLVDEWIQMGVRHAVVAPGSRSTPLALAIAERSQLRLHVFHDERAASFAALGIGRCGPPAILLCTSGTAASHFHAAVIEAHQSSVPIIVCTADRPPELRDVGAPQTIDQTKLYGSAVRWFHDPGVATTATTHTWRSLAAHAFAFATGAQPGPVHLNLPFREPLVGVARDLPPRGSPRIVVEAVSALTDESIDALATSLEGARGVIVAGYGGASADAVRDLATSTGWPVLADARSGVRHLGDVAVSAADHLLRDQSFAADHRPDVVLRLGELPASKVVNQWLAAVDGPQAHISRVPTWIDPDGVVTHRIVADPDTVCRALAHRRRDREPEWLASWLAAERAAQGHFDTVLESLDLTEPLVARLLPSLLPAGAHLVASSSMPIRDLDWFGVIPESVTVHSNRGANGIDGVIATAIGVATATGAPTALLIGDIALLHDSSALVGLMRREVDLRIVVIDNDGGGIFNFLPQASTLPTDRFEQLFGTPHAVDLVALASAHGIPATTVKDRDELATVLAEPGPRVIRIETDRVQNVEVHRRLNG